MKKVLKIILIVLASLVAILAIGFIVLLFLFANPIPPRAGAENIRVASVGDSITYGFGTAWNRGNDSYPAQLQALLGGEYQVLNYGVTGTTLLELVNIYKNLPSHPAVYLLTPPAAFPNSIGASNDIIQNELIPIILRVGEQTNSTVIDIFSATKDHPEYFPDDIHPNASGNRLIAETIYAVISK